MQRYAPSRLIRKFRDWLVEPKPPGGSLCVLPWMHLHVPLDGKVQPCCVAFGAPPAGDLRKSSLKEIWNSKAMRTLRLDMLAGRRNPFCERCYRLEDAGVKSMRNSYNKSLRRHLALPSKTGKDGSIDINNVVYLDVRFSNLCNLKCRSCGSYASTAWYRDDPATAPADFRIVQPTQSSEQLWKQFEPLLPGAEQVNFAGGEPMLMEDHYRMLERLLQLGRPDVALSYNTNLTKLQACGRDVTTLWSQFTKVLVMASFDGSGSRGAYIRHGFDWEGAVRNWMRIRQRCPHVRMIVSTTVSLLNLLHLPSFHAECVERGLIDLDGMTINLVLDPEYLCVTTLPPEIKQQAKAALQARMDQLRGSPQGDVMNARFQEVISFLDSPETTHHLDEFRSRTFALDQRRNENFPTTFPELAQLAIAPNGSSPWPSEATAT